MCGHRTSSPTPIPDAARTTPGPRSFRSDRAQAGLGGLPAEGACWDWLALFVTLPSARHAGRSLSRPLLTPPLRLPLPQKLRLQAEPTRIHSHRDTVSITKRRWFSRLWRAPRMGRPCASPVKPPFIGLHLADGNRPGWRPRPPISRFITDNKRGRLLASPLTNRSPSHRHGGRIPPSGVLFPDPR